MPFKDRYDDMIDDLLEGGDEDVREYLADLGIDVDTDDDEY